MVGASFPRAHLASGMDCCVSCSVARRYKEVRYERERYRDENNAVEHLLKGRGNCNGRVDREAQRAEHAETDERRCLVITASSTSMRRSSP